MSTIQDEANKIVKQKENQDFADSITGQRRKEFESFLEKQKNVIQSYTKEELEYINSEYYPEYLKCLEYLKGYTNNLYTQMMSLYEFNQINFRDAFFRGIKSSINLAGIGFPMPEKFQEQIKNTVHNMLHENLTVDDGEFEVNVIPGEYIITGASGNIGKPTYSYTLNVEFKRKIVKEKQK